MIKNNKIDILNRGKILDKILTIIDYYSSNKKSCTFSLDGKWGSGKSFVLEMVSERLSSGKTNKKKYLIIKYNSWKYDYYREPLIAIISSIIDSIELAGEVGFEDTKKKLLKVCSTLSLAILGGINDTLKEKTGVDIKSVVKDTKNTIKETSQHKNEYNEYFSLDKELMELQKSLNEITKNYTVILLVDEIDRCLPQYSISVLERLHHLTEKIENMITIIATDIEKLKNSVTSIYGDIPTNEYLKKYIDFSVRLDLGELNSKYNKVLGEYYDNFSKRFNETDEQIFEYVKIIFDGIDIRTVIRIVEKSQLIHCIIKDKKNPYPIMIVELLMLVLIDYYHTNISNNRFISDSGKLFDFYKDKPSDKLLDFLNEKTSNFNYSILEDIGWYAFRDFDFDSYFAYCWIYLNWNYNLNKHEKKHKFQFKLYPDELQSIKDFYEYLQIIE